jgi:hypothetical protein
VRSLGRPVWAVGIVAAFAVAAGGGCGSSSEADRKATPGYETVPRLWEIPLKARPNAWFFDRIPDLADVSTWAGQVRYKEAPLPTTSEMPYVGGGNGTVCYLMGTSTPLTTIHGMLGPTYQKGTLEGFFPDVTVSLDMADTPVALEEETIWRVRKTAVLVTRSLAPPLEFWTVCFAPFPEAWPGKTRPEDQSVFLLVYAKNNGSSAPGDLSASVRLGRRGSLEGETLTTVSEGRRLRIVPLGAAGGSHGGGGILRVPIHLAPGQDASLAFALVTSSSRYPEAPALQLVQGLRVEDVEARCVETIRRWRSWYERGAQLETPDTRVDDLVEGLVITDKVSTTIAGGPVEISHYSLVWNRDTYGPMRLFTATARAPEARALLDYHFLAVRHEGGLANAYPADLDEASAPPAPTAEDWALKGVFQGRIAAEGPSYLVLDYLRYLLLRGDLRDFEPADLSARMDMLRACVYQQALSPEGLLPFSGDETFRPQMAISFGLGIDYPFEKRAWSFASGVLLVAACRALARLEQEAAAVLGEDGSGRIRRAERLAEQVGEATKRFFWNEEGSYFEPFLLRDGTVPAGAPYGDVDIFPYWLDVDFQGVPRERAASSLVTRLFSTHKVFFSPADPLLQAMFGRLIGEGIYTGMTPGLTLWTLASVSHPFAEETFNTMDDHADPGGNYPEVVVHDDTSPLTPVYDPLGFVGELWARYRSWEGGINAEAILYFLSGFSGDGQRNRVALRPRLPNGWGFFTLRGLMVGPEMLDLHVQRTGPAAMEVRVWVRGDSSLTAEIGIPGPPLKTVEINGRPIAQGQRRGLEWGGTLTDIGEVVLLPGENRLSVRFDGEIP